MAESHMSTVAGIIDRIRELARAVAKIDAELDKRHGIDPKLGVDYFDPKAVEIRYATNTAEVAMEEYLTSLDEETVRRIEAVMYSGRNGTLAVDERNDLRVNNPTKEDVVRTIIEKRLNFDGYFDRGLERARADGIDVDSF